MSDHRLRGASNAGRAHHALAYDEARQYVVLYGGSTAQGNNSHGYFDDYQEWDGARWTRLDAPGPGPLASMAMAYDPVRRHVVLFGGITKDGMAGETWEWDGTAWHRAGGSG